MTGKKISLLIVALAVGALINLQTQFAMARPGGGHGGGGHGGGAHFSGGGAHFSGHARGRCAETGPMWTVGLHSQFTAYDLARSIGPVSLTMPGVVLGVAVETSTGQLVFGSIAGLTFDARTFDLSAVSATVLPRFPVPTLRSRS